MITRQTKLQLLVFGIISLLGLSYTGMKYAGLGTAFHLQDAGYLVAADFVDSGGIFKGAQVTYRGVSAGKVEDLQLRPNGVRVVLRLKPHTEVPDVVKAVVGNRSAVGEQFVDLQPQRDGAPYLRPDAVIPVAMTSIPVSPTQLVVNLDNLLTSVDTTQLATVLTELGVAFTGTGDSLQRIVDSGDLLTQAATDHLPQTLTLIHDGKVALDTQRDTAGEFTSFSSDLARLTATLRSSDTDFRRLFQTGTQSASEVTDLVDSNRSALPVLLSNLITVAQVQMVRLPAIQQILVTYPNVVAGGFTVVPGDGTTHFGMATTANPQPCRLGYDKTVKRDPSQTTLNTSPNLGAYCAEKASDGVGVRGAQNEPRPAGESPYPGSGSATATSGSSAAGSSSASTSPAAQANSVLLGDYDPVTGNVVTEDGQRLTIGSSANADRLFGGSSWQWLLLGPLSS